ncbi:pentatricopeptide repeat-containing protein At4g35130, chloroplastic-like [Fagus crenata]
MSLYAQFHDIDCVIRVFNTSEKPHTIAWNLIIKSHLDLGLFDSALLLYKTMRHLGVAHDSFTFPIVNQAVLSLQSDVIYGEMVHCVSTKIGFGFEVYFCNTMIEVYVKCGCVVYARKLFDEMSQRDLVSWTSMISGYVCEGSVGSAFYLFREMMVKSEPNSVTLIIMLQACCAGESLIHGMQLHGYAIKSGLESDGSLQNSVLKMYTRTGSVEEVEIYFSKIDRKDDVSWNILISFYSMKGDIEKLVNRFSEMQGIAALSIETLTLLISAFAKSRDLFQGEQIHCVAIKSGFCDDVLLTSLLDFYAKSGKIEISDQLFRKISYRNNITFGAMMSGFVQNGYVKDAINLFHQMQAANVEPGAEILRSILDAYTQLGALQLEKHESTKLEAIKHYTKDLKVSDLNGNEEVYFPTEREVKMMGDQNHLDPRPVDGALSLVLIRLAYDEPSCSCIAHFCDRMDTVFYWVRLLQNRLNVNPSVEEKWVSGMGAIHESLNRKCLPLCSDHINDLYTGKITLQDIDCTLFVDVD